MEQDFEIAKTNKWINGKAVVPVEVCGQYAGKKGINLLSKDIERKIIPNILDIPMLMDKITLIVRVDDTIHDKKKKELLSGSAYAVKLARVIQFAILRDKEKKETGLAISVVSRFCGVEVPFLTNVFLGRKEELKELHGMLQKYRSVFVTGIAGIGKSEIVRQYARQYGKHYVNIIYLTYEKIWNIRLHVCI